MAEVTKKLLDENGGKLPSFAWPGGYPLFYLDHENFILCPDCANKEEIENLVAYDAHWEGEPLTCEECNGKIESAYGVPEQEAEDNE